MRQMIFAAALAAAGACATAVQAQSIEDILGRVLGGNTQQGGSREQDDRRRYNDRREGQDRMQMLEDADRRIGRDIDRLEEDRRRVRAEMRRLEDRR